MPRGSELAFLLLTVHFFIVNADGLGVLAVLALVLNGKITPFGARAEVGRKLG